MENWISDRGKAMRITDNDIMNISDYLSGHLSDDDKTAFEQELRRRPELQLELKLQRQMQEGLSDLLLLEKIRRIHEPYQRQSHLRPLWSYLSVAASLVLVAAVFGLIRYRERQQSLRLFTAYYQHPAVQLNAPAAPDTEAFEQGLRLLDRDETNAAIALLKTARHPYATWYLALAYLKNGEPEEARTLLRGLANDERAFFRRDAARLLQQLDHEPLNYLRMW